MSICRSPPNRGILHAFAYTILYYCLSAIRSGFSALKLRQFQAFVDVDISLAFLFSPSMAFESSLLRTHEEHQKQH